MPLSGLSYYGGKSGESPTGNGRWVGSLLPTEGVVTYVEPFAGMLGVLLQRPPVTVEVANDLHEYLIFWWTAVRDRGDELAEAVRLTPCAEAEHKRAVAAWKCGFVGLNELEKARLITVLLWQTYGGKEWGSGWWLPGPGRKGDRSGRRVANKIDRLAERMANVSLYCRDALNIVERFARGGNDTLIYLDPPYEAAYTDAYEIDDLDREALADVLSVATCRAAISGYGDEWDHLGWERHTFNTYQAVQILGAGDERPVRTEVLWTNFTPPGQGGLFD